VPNVFIESEDIWREWAMRLVDDEGGEEAATSMGGLFMIHYRDAVDLNLTRPLVVIRRNMLHRWQSDDH
jgi:hypothetical protein